MVIPHGHMFGQTEPPFTKFCKMAEPLLISAACVAYVTSPSNSTGQVGTRSTSALSASSFLLKRSMNDGLERNVRKRSYWLTISIVLRELCPLIHEFKPIKNARYLFRFATILRDLRLDLLA